jgi:hypothetical protein
VLCCVKQGHRLAPPKIIVHFTFHLTSTSVKLANPSVSNDEFESEDRSEIGVFKIIGTFRKPIEPSRAKDSFSDTTEDSLGEDSGGKGDRGRGLREPAAKDRPEDASLLKEMYPGAPPEIIIAMRAPAIEAELSKGDKHLASAAAQALRTDDKSDLDKPKEPLSLTARTSTGADVVGPGSELPKDDTNGGDPARKDIGKEGFDRLQINLSATYSVPQSQQPSPAVLSDRDSAQPSPMSVGSLKRRRSSSSNRELPSLRQALRGSPERLSGLNPTDDYTRPLPVQGTFEQIITAAEKGPQQRQEAFLTASRGPILSPISPTRGGGSSNFHNENQQHHRRQSSSRDSNFASPLSASSNQKFEKMSISLSQSLSPNGYRLSGSSFSPLNSSSSQYGNANGHPSRDSESLSNPSPQAYNTPTSPNVSSTSPGNNSTNPESPSITGTYFCDYPGCKAAPFLTQYLLTSHKTVHSTHRPFLCTHPGCERSKPGNGFKRKNEMLRHGLVHQSPGYICPFCPVPSEASPSSSTSRRNSSVNPSPASDAAINETNGSEGDGSPLGNPPAKASEGPKLYRYPRPDNLQRHVRFAHADIAADDPRLRAVLAQRAEGTLKNRRTRTVAQKPKAKLSKETSSTNGHVEESGVKVAEKNQRRNGDSQSNGNGLRGPGNLTVKGFTSLGSEKKVGGRIDHSVAHSDQPLP